MGEHLIDTSSRHYIATQEDGDLSHWSLLSCDRHQPDRHQIDRLVRIWQHCNTFHFVVLKRTNCDGSKPECGGLKADILRSVANAITV